LIGLLVNQSSEMSISVLRVWLLQKELLLGRRCRLRRAKNTWVVFLHPDDGVAYIISSAGALYFKYFPNLGIETSSTRSDEGTQSVMRKESKASKTHYFKIKTSILSFWVVK
jgi:hypothetical protein